MQGVQAHLERAQLALQPAVELQLLADDAIERRGVPAA